MSALAILLQGLGPEGGEKTEKIPVWDLLWMVDGP